MTGEIRTDRGGLDRPAAPALNPHGKPDRCRSHIVFNVADPALARLAQAQLDRALLKREPQRLAESCEGHNDRSSHGLNLPSICIVHMLAGDIVGSSSHHVNMAQPLSHDWFLREWFATAGLKQNDLVTKLDLPKNTAHRLWHGLQPYRRDHVEQIAALLNIHPYELLMPPEEAMGLRRLRSAIAEVAAPPADSARPIGDAQPRTGTDG